MAQILVIDDQEEIRELLRRFLTSAGYDVLTASNGRAGKKLFNADHVDLVITDIFMPEEDGLETIMSMRQHHPDVKIIAISGGGSLGNIDMLQAAKRLGAFRVFTKPFELEALLEAVREAIPAPPAERT